MSISFSHFITNQTGPKTQVASTLFGKSYAIEKVLPYAAAHFMLHDQESVPLEFIGGAKRTESDLVVDFGGMPERPYYAVRDIYRRELGLHRHPLQLFTKHKVPPYYMARGGDVALDETSGLGCNLAIASFAAIVQDEVKFMKAHIYSPRLASL